MKILQNQFLLKSAAFSIAKMRAGAVLGVAVSLSALSGCSANSEPHIPFVESANAEASDQELVNLGKDGEKFSQADSQPDSSAQLSVAQDRMPLTKVAGTTVMISGEAVESLNLALIPPNTSWQYTYYVNYPMVINGQSTVGHKAVLGTGTTRVNNNELGFDVCGDIPVTQSIIDEVRYPPYAPEACALNEITTQFYQSADDFAVEYYCSDKLVSARYYQKVANEKIGFYRFEFSQLAPPQDYSDTNACAEITNYWNEKESKGITTVADIYGSILRDSYHLRIQLNPVPPNQSFFTFDDVAREHAHDFAFNFPPLGRYSSTQTTSGFILWERSANPLNLRAEFEVLIEDIVEGERQVDGYIESNW